VIWFALVVFAMTLASNVLLWMKVTKSLGLRADWKRRFDKMKEGLGL
jgi:hypothetical protein